MDTEEATEDKMAIADTIPKRIRLKIEIIECNNILIGDKTSSDPYVKIKFGGSRGKELHYTKHRVQTLNPRYAAVHQNMYQLDVTEDELYEHNGLVFKVKDWDKIGHNDD